MKRRPLAKIAALTKDQQTQLAAWLFDDSLTYKSIIERAEAEFGVTIDRTTLCRQRRRLEEDTYLTAHRTNPDFAAEIAEYSATGQAKFSQAAQLLLQKHAFDLAVATNRENSPPEDVARAFDRLEAAMKILLAQQRAEIDQQNANTRQQNADTNRLNAQTRQGELDLKREKFEYLQTRELAPQSTKPQPATSPEDSATANSVRHTPRLNLPNAPESNPNIPSETAPKSPIFLQFPPVSSKPDEHVNRPVEQPLDSDQHYAIAP